MALPFYGNPLMNEDPLSKAAELMSLRVWYKQLPLIGTNFLGVLAMYAMYRVGNATFGVSIAVATLYSVLYHVCQTTGVCFHANLVITTMMDHITAPSMAGIIMVVSVTPITAKMLLVTHQHLEEKLRKMAATQPHTALYGEDDNEPNTVVDLTGTEQEARRRSYYYQELYREENTVRDAWSATIVYCYIFVAVNATLAHPFSMQSFLIVIAFGLGVVFFKVVVIDDGQISHNAESVSVPDVLIGIALVSVSLIFFVLDSWFYYWIFHSLWHAFSFTGVYFYGMGLSKGLPNFYSPYEQCRAWLTRNRRPVQSV